MSEIFATLGEILRDIQHFRPHSLLAQILVPEASTWSDITGTSICGFFRPRISQSPAAGSRVLRDRVSRQPVRSLRTNNSARHMRRAGASLLLL